MKVALTSISRYCCQKDQVKDEANATVTMKGLPAGILATPPVTVEIGASSERRRASANARMAGYS